MKHAAIETRSATPLEVRNDGDTPPIEAAVAAVEEMRTTFDQRMQAVDDLEERLADLETRSQRPNAGGGQPTEEELERRAFDTFVRSGLEALEPDERRNLTTAQNGGGFLAPETFVNEIVKSLVQFSPIRQYARVMTISAGEAKMPKRTGTITAAWVTETGNRPSTDPTYEQATLTPHEAACYVDVSNALLEDNSYNLEGELSLDFAEEFGRLEGAAFVSGTGSGQPTGLMTDTDVVEVAGGHASQITSEGLITLFHALPGFYAANGAWMMNRTTIGEVRKLKNTAGDFIWREPLSEGNPASILGRPVVECPEMPDIAANANPIVFGDLRQAYRIVDRIQLAVLRDPYSRATNGQTRFHARRRTGGDVIKAEAARKLRIATSVS